MEMKIEGVTISRKKGGQAVDFVGMLQGYAYGLFYFLSEVKLIDLRDGNVPALEQLMEARLFSGEKELHIFQNENGWMAVSVEETGESEYLDGFHPLSKKFQTVGKQLGVRKYISYDDDGQAYVALTRLCGVK